MPIPAAAGYPQYSGSILLPPMFSDHVIERFYAESIIADISSTEYIGELEKYGDQISFPVMPDVRVRRGTKGGTITHDHIDVSTRTITIGNLLESSYVIDPLDSERMKNWSKWQTALTNGVSRKYAEFVDSSALAALPAMSHPANRGATAGVRSGVYNLGVTGTPVSVTAANIWQTLLNVKSAMVEQKAGREGLYIVLPEIAEPILTSSPLFINNAAMAGNSLVGQLLINGKAPSQVLGMDVYFSPFVAPIFDAGAAANCYNCVFGYKTGLCYASILEDARVVKDQADSWNEYIQSRFVYGMDVLRPELLGNLYARFS